MKYNNNHLPMNLKYPTICKKRIQEIYYNKHREGMVSEINSLLECTEHIQILQFYQAILFYDVPCIKKCPAFLLLLFKSYSLSSFLIKKHLGIEISQELFLIACHSLLNSQITVINDKIEIEFVFDNQKSISTIPSSDVFKTTNDVSTLKNSKPSYDEMLWKLEQELLDAKSKFKDENVNVEGDLSNKRIKMNSECNDELEDDLSNKYIYSECNDRLKLVRLLLRYETQLHDLYNTDNGFLVSLFEGLEKNKKSEILSSKPITPLKTVFSKRDSNFNEFYRFLILETLPFMEAFNKASNMNNRKLRKIILFSDFSYIRSKIKLFYSLFPEFMAFDKAIHPQRFNFITLPRTIIMDYKLILTYTRVASIISGWSPETEMNLQVFYILKIIKTLDKQLLNKVVNFWIYNSEFLVEKVFCSKPSISSVAEFIKDVPNIKLHFSVFLKLAKATREQYFFDFIVMIVKEEPCRKHIELIKDNLLYFNPTLVKEFKFLLEQLS